MYAALPYAVHAVTIDAKDEAHPGDVVRVDVRVRTKTTRSDTHVVHIGVTGPDGNGRMQWETPPGGLAGIVVHNVAEADARSHLLTKDAVVRVEARLDRSSPPDMVYLTCVPAAETMQRLARVVSYSGGTYTVQPVRREGGQFVDDGDPVAGVPNVGELWPDEAGYLAGPSEYDRYVPLTWTASGWIIVLHPPRMV